VAKDRSDAEQQVAELLLTAKKSLHLSVAFLTRMDGTTQHLEVVESSVPFLFKEGVTQQRDTSLCQAVADKKLPAVMPNLKDFPLAMTLPAARLPRIRSFVSVPVTLSDGTMYGTFCAAGLTSDKALSKRDQSLMDVLAHAAAVILEPGVRERARRTEILDRLRPVMAGGGPLVVLQPIVDLLTGARIGAEALSRFPAAWGKAPDVCFEEAHSVGLGDELELQALAGAAEHLDLVPGYIAMNISPGTVLTREAAELFARLPLDRVLLELSEHDQVEDYAALMAVLAPLRARGMRLAIDDVGAGFSSLRHIVLTSPDVIKLDRSMIDRVSTDAVLTKLVRSLVAFGHDCDCQVVAEGVETEPDAAALRDLGVDYGQGWHFGRPAPVADYLEPAPGPTAVAPARRGSPAALS
jgi:EAL domain-containing protein (putative c-di-GMP-specific phosphodiesterase class I)